MCLGGYLVLTKRFQPCTAIVQHVQHVNLGTTIIYDKQTRHNFHIDSFNTLYLFVIGEGGRRLGHFLKIIK